MKYKAQIFFNIVICIGNICINIDPAILKKLINTYRVCKSRPIKKASLI